MGFSSLTKCQNSEPGLGRWVSNTKNRLQVNVNGSATPKYLARSASTAP
jgi:hypothetical protein